MKMKFMMVAAAVAVIGTTACVKESGADVDNTPTSVGLKLVDDTELTRASAAPVQNVAVTFNSGYVFFTNDVDVIVKRTKIETGSYVSGADLDDDAAYAAGNKVWINDLKTTDNGGIINNVPGSAVKVYIAANLPQAEANVPTVAANISAVKALVVTAGNQGNAQGNVNNVTLYGDGVALGTHPSLANTKYAKVSVNAVGARIEINKISYDAANYTLLTGFQVDGIFVNQYYTEMSLDSKVDVTKLSNIQPADATAADAAFKSGVAPYTTAGVLFDYNAAGIGVDATGGSKLGWTANSGTNVWAYNVLAPKTATTAATLVAPHVVIRLSGITDANSLYAGKTQYLTVKEFKKASDKSVITTFLPGYVYYITDLVFNESHLTNVPEEETLTVYVEAKLMTWTRQEVEWGY